MASLKISPRAQKDMLEIKEYISEELCNQKAATDVLFEITKRIRNLIEFPLIGASLSSIIDIETGYRLSVGNILLFIVMKMILSL